MIDRLFVCHYRRRFDQAIHMTECSCEKDREIEWCCEVVDVANSMVHEWMMWNDAK